MLLTITTTHRPATDLGYLLHKNPDNVNSIDLSFGQAHVFYPEATLERCTAALLLDIDPVALVRKSAPNQNAFALQPYVNDRPYVASSFMSVALNKAFGTTFSGKSKSKQELVDQDIALEVCISALPCYGGEKLLRKLFEPLGYEVEAENGPVDESFPDWGQSPYFKVTLKRCCPLREFLVHLYVLIPVLDNEKHYWIGEDEVSKLLKFGEGWLPSHPERELIARRYLKNFRTLTEAALESLSEEQAEDIVPDVEAVEPSREQALERKIHLNEQRLDYVAQKLKALSATSVVDLGCGEGRLIRLLQRDKFFERILGCDVSLRALEVAKDSLKLERLSESQQRRIGLMVTALTYRDDRLAGFDAATLIEVIEHLDLPRLDALSRVVFEFAKPASVIVTTPNVEYNVLFEKLAPGQMRHSDHRFEWTRTQFHAWANEVAVRFGYAVSFEDVGPVHEVHGAPTQAGIFVRQ